MAHQVCALAGEIVPTRRPLFRRLARLVYRCHVPSGFLLGRRRHVSLSSVLLLLLLLLQAKPSDANSCGGGASKSGETARVKRQTVGSILPAMVHLRLLPRGTRLFAEGGQLRQSQRRRCVERGNWWRIDGWGSSFADFDSNCDPCWVVPASDENCWLSCPSVSARTGVAVDGTWNSGWDGRAPSGLNTRRWRTGDCCTSDHAHPAQMSSYNTQTYDHTSTL